MILRSKSIGEVTVREDAVLYFTDGLVGFEELKHFILADVAEFQPFLWLLSTEEPELGFAVADPQLFHPGHYEVSLGEVDKDALDLQAGDSVSVFVIVSITEGGRRITANLKGPIVLNTRNRMCRQVVIYHPGYSVRQPLLGPDLEESLPPGSVPDRSSARG